MTAAPLSPLVGIAIRSCPFLAGTSLAYLDIHELQVSPELCEKLRAAKAGDIEKCFEGVTILNLREYRECKG